MRMRMDQNHETGGIRELAREGYLVSYHLRVCTGKVPGPWFALFFQDVFEGQ